MITIGNLILLNLFLAMLISNFMTNRQKVRVDGENILVYSFGKLKRQWKSCHKKTRVNPKTGEPIEESSMDSPKKGEQKKIPKK